MDAQIHIIENNDYNELLSSVKRTVTDRIMEEAFQKYLRDLEAERTLRSAARQHYYYDQFDDYDSDRDGSEPSSGLLEHGTPWEEMTRLSCNWQHPSAQTITTVIQKHIELMAELRLHMIDDSLCTNTRNGVSHCSACNFTVSNHSVCTNIPQSDPLHVSEKCFCHELRQPTTTAELVCHAKNLSWTCQSHKLLWMVMQELAVSMSMSPPASSATVHLILFRSAEKQLPISFPRIAKDPENVPHDFFWYAK